MDKTALLLKLKAMQKGIRFESDDDEGAAEYWGEIQSVIMVIENGGSDQEILKAKEWVGLSV